MEDDRKQVAGASDEQSGSANEPNDATSKAEAQHAGNIVPENSPTPTESVQEPAHKAPTEEQPHVAAAESAFSEAAPEVREETVVPDSPEEHETPDVVAAAASSPAEGDATAPAAPAVHPPKPQPAKKEPLSPEVLAKWKELQEALHQKKTVEMRVLKKVKGGTILDYKGLDVFMPFSHWHLGTESGDAEIDKVLGHSIPVRVIEVSSPEKGRVLASRRKILMEERCAQLKEGEEMKGRITGVTSFGVFVDVGGVEGLIHISQLMSRRGMTAAEQLKVGDEVDVSIFRIDQKRGRVWLNLRGFVTDAWKEVPAKYPLGSVHKAKVVDIKKYGVFVELEPGIEAFLHAQEMSWTSRIKDPGEQYKQGDEIEVKVLKIKENAQKIEVSVKQLAEDPWPMLALSFRKGTVCEGKVKEVLEKGIVIELPDKVDGFLPRSKMSPRGGGDPIPDPAVGDTLTLRVVDVSAEKQFIILGIFTPRPERSRDDRRGGHGHGHGHGRDRDRGRGESGPPAGHQPTLGELISEKIRKKLFPGRG